MIKRSVFISLAIMVTASSTLSAKGTELVSPQSVPGLKLRPCVDNVSRIALSVPDDWTVSESPEKNFSLKATPRPGADLHGEITVHRLVDCQAPEDSARILEREIFQKLSDYKKVSEQTVRFGSQNLQGVAQSFTAKMDGMNFWQERFYFQGTEGYVVSIAFTAPPQKAQRMQAIATNVIASVVTKKTSQVASSTTSSAGNNSFSFTTFSSKKDGVSFSYPANWKVELTGEGNLVAKMTGNGPSGKLGAISLHSAPETWLSAEDVARSLDGEAAQRPEIADYKTVHEESQNFGAHSDLPGYMIENTFKYNGQNANRLSAYFSAQNRHYVFDVCGFGWSPNELRSLFARVSGSFKTE